MGLKAKLLSCVAMFVFIVGIVVVGVLAASNADFLFQGDLNYNIADKTLYVKDVQYQHGMIGEPVTVPGFREGYINNGFELNIESAQIETNTVGNFVLYFDIINLIVDNQTHEYVASASWADTAVTGISFSIDTSSATIAKGTVTPENLTDSTPISGRIALEIRSTVDQTFDLSNIAVLFSQAANLDEIDYALNDDGSITINDYSGSGANIVIPDSYTVSGVTYPVTSVGSETFSGNTDIQTVTLPDTITSIGESTFNSCSNLTTINLPDGLTEIGTNAFSYCTSLTEIVFPDTLTTIGDAAFFNCVLVSGTLNIPASVISIGERALTLMGLTEITVDANNQYFTADSGVLYNKDMTELIAYPHSKTSTNFVVPSSVKTIAMSAFRESRVSGTLTLSPNLEYIGAEAFYGCTRLNNTLTIPATVTYIGSSAFGGCRLTGIEVAEGNTAYMSENGVLYDSDQTLLIQYPRGKTDTSFIVPDSVSTIGNHAFNGASMSSITLPSGLSEIGAFGFYSCSNLIGQFEIPASITTIGTAAFSGTNITSFSSKSNYFTTVDGVLYNEDMTTLMQYPAGKTDASFAVPNGVQTIAGYAFRNSKLQSITIPSSVTTLNSNVFMNCTSLATVTIDSQTIAAMLTSKLSARSLIQYATTVYVSESAVSSLPAEFANMFSEVSPSDQEGYRKYTLISQ